ncbi:Oidioi.mRNA.OKI2018_I69.chr2.g5776.t1.cds [Oikopleura dioica]|uniref:Oidioi.mRNA.OKI2018_I69.chr2.g5776.t1.cds n=1 Tax=Oikopleura dioica TaxID=34765 RepID=A0ABN7T0V2_OIKDI|nr:Oidioi.mRNA.OKI2018_I69.chr2.g5776.t1.cds [Oikopleura dioica]
MAMEFFEREEENKTMPSYHVNVQVAIRNHLYDAKLFINMASTFTNAREICESLNMRLPPEGFAIIENPSAFDERTSMMFWIDAFVSPDTAIFTRAEKPGRVLIERLLGERVKSDGYLAYVINHKDKCLLNFDARDIFPRVYLCQNDIPVNTITSLLISGWTMKEYTKNGKEIGGKLCDKTHEVALTWFRCSEHISSSAVCDGIFLRKRASDKDATVAGAYDTRHVNAQTSSVLCIQ